MKLPIKLPQGLTRAAGKLWMRTKGASPEICVVGGLIAGGAALVMVGVKTWKGKDILAKDIKAIEEAKKTAPKPKKTESGEKTEESKALVPAKEAKQLVLAKRIDFAKDICKVYWIPTVLGISSVGLIWGGRTILRKELASLAAAYTTLAESYRRYRERVIAEYGKEKDEEFQYGVKAVEAIDAETGETEKKLIINKEDNISEYAFIFDEGDYDRETGRWGWKNNKWSTSNIDNKLTVISIKKEAEFRIKNWGYCILEDVALMFGIDPDIASRWHDIGWIYKPGELNNVEFGVEPTKDFQLDCNVGFWDDRSRQNVCVINPNVDGYIGYIRGNYKAYDFRYGAAKPKYKSVKREMSRLVHGYREEQMERLIEGRKTATEIKG